MTHYRMNKCINHTIICRKL